MCEDFGVTCDQALLCLLVREGLERILSENSSPDPNGQVGREGPDRRLTLEGNPLLATQRQVGARENPDISSSPTSHDLSHLLEIFQGLC